MSISDLIKLKPYLFWYVKDPEKLSEESILENILNYGDWDDVQEFIRIKGKAVTAGIFNRTLKKKRCNYSAPIKAYFCRYFKADNS